MTQKIIILSTIHDLEKSFPLLRELRTNLSFENFQDIYHNAHKTNDYTLVGLEDEGQLVALMGYRILHDFVHGKHLYIDDLVSSSHLRSKGYGTTLLLEAERLAQLHGCSNLRLCTGIENESGKKFYEKNQWNLRAIVFKKKL